MKVFKITQLDKLSDEYKEQAINVFFDGFGHLFSFEKDRKILIELFKDSIDYSLVYVAICDDKVVGLIGVGNNKTRAMKFDIEKCKKLFGNVKGSIIKKQFAMIMEKPAVTGEKDLYIDYLTTDKKYRGIGIGTKLIGYACDYIDGYDQCYIEVLSKNKNAKRLYENIGFIQCKKSLNIFTILSGDGYPIKLKKFIK